MRTRLWLYTGFLAAGLTVFSLTDIARPGGADEDAARAKAEAMVKDRMKAVRADILRDAERALAGTPGADTPHGNAPRDTRPADPTRKPAKKKGGYLGVYPQEDAKGIKLAKVTDGNAAAQAGLKDGDIITAMDGLPMEELSALFSFLASKTEGDIVLATYLRGDEEMQTKITLGGRPESASTSSIGLPDVPDPGEGRPDLSPHEHSWRPMPPDANGLDPKDLRRLGARAGADVQWIASFDEAKKIAAETGRPILWSPNKELGQDRYNAGDFRIPGSPTYDGIDYDIYMRVTMFSYPSTVDLINAKFVPLRCRIDSETAKAYGLTRYKFIEPGLLILSPDAQRLHVIDRIATYSEQFFYGYLQSLLNEYPALDKPAADAARIRKRLEGGDVSITDVLDFGESLIRSGDLDEADQFLDGFAKDGFFEGETLARYHLMKARQQRLRGDRAAALDHLSGSLRAAGGNESLAAASLLESVNLMLLDGALDDAMTACDSVLRQYPKTAEAAEAKYRVGQIHWLQKREREAQAAWKDLCRTFPDSNAAACAAYYLTGDGPLTHSVEVLAALPKTSLPSAPADNTQIRPDRAQLPALRRRAADWLAQEQRSTGEWNDSPYDFMGAQHRPNTHMAVTALAACSLLDMKEARRGPLATTLERADAFIRDHANLSSTPIEKVYAYAYMMMYHCKRIQNGMGTDPKDIAAIETLAEKLGKHQSPQGQWGHEYYNPFCHATVLYSLRMAQDLGARISSEMLDKGIKALQATRSPEGAYGYMFGMPGNLRGDFGRTPLCELALFVHGQSDQEKLCVAVDNFFKYKGDLERVRQYDYHADPNANGGFFFYYDLWPISEALSKITDPGKRKQYAETLTEMMLTYPEIDGSWVDSMNIGKGYGTAMALMILTNLEMEP